MRMFVVLFSLVLLTEASHYHRRSYHHITPESECRYKLEYATCWPLKYRTLDGSCNNKHHITYGAADTPLRRFTRSMFVNSSTDYPRGFPGTASSSHIPLANKVARTLFKPITKNTQHTKKGTSVMFMTFGQFMDHDMSLTPHAECHIPNCADAHKAFKYPCFPIKFSHSSPTCTVLGRSVTVCGSKGREFINIISSYIDASNVYGSKQAVNDRIRKYDGTGEMKLLPNGLLPLRSENCKLPAGCSLAGEGRSDENIALNAMHTLWVREHNRIVKKLRKLNPYWEGEELFETTRKIVGAMLQHITYEEFLPFLVTLGPYKRYDWNLDPSISNGFSAAAFRFGHSLIPNTWAQLNNNFDKIKPDLPIRKTFRNIATIRNDGIEPTMFGLLANQSQDVDTKFAFNIARRLFVPPGSSGYRDLTAINIQRGRDHGVPTYGQWRRRCGLKSLKTFSDLHGIIRPSAITHLRKLYKNPNNIDLYAAGISEIPLPGRKLGETFHCIIKDQFERLRSGDRFFYLNPGVFTKLQLEEIKKVSLSKVLCDNLKGVVSLQRNAFKSFNSGEKRVVCDSIPGIDLNKWKDTKPYPYNKLQNDIDVDSVEEEDEDNQRYHGDAGDEEETEDGMEDVMENM